MSLDESVMEQKVIDAGRFVLRPLRKSDEGLIAHYVSDERVARMTSAIPHPLPPGAIEAFVTRAMDPTREEDVWAIDSTSEGGEEPKGIISLKRLDRDQSEVGYWIAPVFWNNGLASAALQTLVETNPQNCSTLFATAFQDNPAAARVLTHCGFEYLGDAETYSVARDATVPTWTYSRKL